MMIRYRELKWSFRIGIGEVLKELTWIFVTFFIGVVVIYEYKESNEECVYLF